MTRISSSPNEIMSLAAAEGRWSCWVKRTGECSLCDDGEGRGHWADVSSLVTRRSNPLPRYRSLKRKLSASAERQDWNSRNENSRSRWAERQHGFSPSMTHTQRECHQHIGESRMAEGINRICKLAAARDPIQLLRRFNGGSWHQWRISEEESS